MILTIDQGTSGTKALLHDGDRVLAVVERELRPRYGEGGSVEIDADALLESVLESGRAALAEAGNPHLDLVSLANQGESVLAWDRATGAALTPVIGWQDRRAQSVCGDLAPRGDEIAARTGLTLDPYFSAPKMAWLRRELSREGVVTTTDSWLLYRLAGAFVTDEATASRSLLLDLDRRTWDPELAELFGLGDEELPELVANDEIVGLTSAFGALTPVGGVIVDQQAALFAQSCLSPGEAKCTFGTGLFLVGNIGELPVRSQHGLTTSVAWRLRDRADYSLDGQALAGGSSLRWLVGAGILSAADALDAECGPDSRGAVFVPGLAGLAAPHWSPSSRGSFTGLGLDVDRGALIRAVVEGLAAQVATLVATLGRESGVAVTRLRVDGGLTRSRELLQTQANLLQIPVDRYPSPHATALGGVALGRLALDPGLRPADAVIGWEPVESFEPQWSADRADAVLTTWGAALSATLPLGVSA